MKVGLGKGKKWLALVPASGTILLSSASGGMSGDIFNLLITDTMGYDPSVLSLVYIGMLCSIPIQFLGPTIAQRLGLRKIMLLGAGSCLLAIVILLGSMSLSERIILIVLSTTLIEIAYSLSYGTVWSAWTAELFSPHERPIFLSISRGCSQLVMAAAFLVQTILFKGSVTFTFYRIICSLLIVYLISSCVIYFVLPQGADGWAQGHGASDLNSGKSVNWISWLASPDYRLIAYSAISQVFIGVPLLSVYIVSILGFPNEILGVALLARTTASLVALFFIGRWIQAVGAARAAIQSGRLVSICLIGWLLLSLVANRELLISIVMVSLVVAFSLSKSVFSISISNLTYDLVEKKDRVQIFTMVDLFSSTSLQISAALGALAISSSKNGNFLSIFGASIDVIGMWIVAAIILSVSLTRAVQANAVPVGGDS